ncbi:hypothetical protein DTO271G3_420 [Paecilomyces variotii]|nr:hypothetical protein DTO271G3_420 [Paecilomyces variotii]
MQITKISLFLFAAIAAVANPIDAESDGLVDRDVDAADITYAGECFRKNNECRYVANGKTHYVKCPSKFANQRCQMDKHKCTYDSYNGVVNCVA